MGLVTTDDSTNRVNFGHGSSLANLTQQTVLFWFTPSNSYFTQNTYRELIGRHDASYFDGWGLYYDGPAYGQGRLQFIVDDHTTYEKITCRSTAVFAHGSEQCVAETIDH